MDAIITNRGLACSLEWGLRNNGTPTNLYIALLSPDSDVPTIDINTLSELTEIDAGNGYTAGGFQLSRNDTDFTVVENDTDGEAQLTIKDVYWDATGGGIGPARYAVLLDDNATVADRQVLAAWDLGVNRYMRDGNRLTIKDMQLKLASSSNWTNRGLYLLLTYVFQNDVPSNFYVALIQGVSAAPTAATNVLSDLTEETTGYGYTAGGMYKGRNTGGWEATTENDSSDYAEIEMTDTVWAASGGVIGENKYPALCDDTSGDHQVIAYWEFTQLESCADGYEMHCEEFKLRLTNGCT